MHTENFNLQSFRKFSFIAPNLFSLILLLSTPFKVFAQGYPKAPVAVKEESGGEQSNSDGCKELLRAVKSQDSVRVKELLRNVDPNCIFRGDGEPRSPLVAAARAGYVGIGKLLLEAKADVAYHAEGDETPLMAASANGHLGFAKLLVSNGAEVNKKLKREGTALIIAAREGHLGTVEYLISQGADVNAQVTGDGSPLIIAVRKGHLDIAKVLLEKGADPYLASPGDENPLYHARMSQNREMVELLEEYSDRH
ncbi:ankyrin repeat domain-containing protein [Nafulsella turpanensis]|uniref:ankyrin repeat domain-containing protein n=1 Tax=Nafulsella turpanensis TaxID=1265690 RepID=UPI000348D0ED|nr:ankyrin repeat domain-containing protein [Nafulsella turpanensis]